MRYGSGTKYYGHAAYRNIAAYETIFTASQVAAHWSSYTANSAGSVMDSATRTVIDDVTVGGTPYPRIVSTGWEIVTTG